MLNFFSSYNYNDFLMIILIILKYEGRLKDSRSYFQFYVGNRLFNNEAIIERKIVTFYVITFEQIRTSINN